MAQVEVRIRINRTFTVNCDGENEDEVFDDIIDFDRINDNILSEAYNNMEIVSAEYDEPVPDDTGGSFDESTKNDIQLPEKDKD